YGVSKEWLATPSCPQPGRVLFVGTANLRKGIHVLARAAERLAGRGKPYDIRAAGGGPTAGALRRECRHLPLPGRVPLLPVEEELARAGGFVLAWRAEGAAEATYEALAAGVPVVTTTAAGSVVRDGIEGRIVPEGDPEALAEALQELVADRPRRTRMARAARD